MRHGEFTGSAGHDDENDASTVMMAVGGQRRGQARKAATAWTRGFEGI